MKSMSSFIRKCNGFKLKFQTAGFMKTNHDFTVTKKGCQYSATVGRKVWQPVNSVKTESKNSIPCPPKFPAKSDIA